jgi:hypothetical protein
MKFLRIGKEGQEIPIVLDKDGDNMELSIDNLGRQNIKVLAE